MSISVVWFKRDLRLEDHHAAGAPAAPWGLPDPLVNHKDS